MLALFESFILLPSGEGARRADEGLYAKRFGASVLNSVPHPALRATFPQRGKGEEKDGALPCFS